MALLAWITVAAACGSGSGDPRDPPPPSRPVSTTTWIVELTDGPSGPRIAGHVLLIGAANEPLHIGGLDVYETRQARAACALGPDVLGTWDGILVARGVAAIAVGVPACDATAPAIPYGHYAVWAWRGPEHELWKGSVDLSEHQWRVTTRIPLERVWRPPGLAADLHVHAAASPDSLVPNPSRVLAQIAAGVDVIGLSDHNAAGDLDAEIQALGLDTTITSIASNEISGEGLHLGVYPFPVDRTKPQGGAMPAELAEASTHAELFAHAAAIPGAPVIQLNHPRLRATALFDAMTWDGVAWPPPFALKFDAVEVLAGHTAFNGPDDQRVEQALGDFYTLVDHGYLVTALGNSDTHHLNGVRDAVTRNYVDAPAGRPFDEAAFVDAIRRRRTWATTGPLLDVEVRAQRGSTGVGPGGAFAARGSVVVDVTLYQARWVVTDALRIRVGGDAGVTLDLKPVARGVREHRVTVPVTLGKRDAWIGVDAIGLTPLLPELTGSAYADEGHDGAVPAAVINPILVDVDGDGFWTRGIGRVRIEDGGAVGGRASLRAKR